MHARVERGLAWSLVVLYIFFAAVELTLQAIAGKPHMEEIRIPGLMLVLVEETMQPARISLWLKHRGGESARLDQEFFPIRVRPQPQDRFKTVDVR